ncbi:sulfonate/nitrate transport system ATP-binding protein [Moorella sp. E308F]|uniref:AAA-associated domain-containing protein n=1 Tax=Moorella sp. E308F TaxID=2572682 RepID=UPI0010FFC535|nr:AAA-associated domain-containing protein [Moorella sp. E308F]GEA14939.1 sulfonate/nitrate transport system ATP-binding protein [Moorella sp. E308F]
MDAGPLPQVGIGMVIGLLEMLEDVRGREDIFKLAGSLSMELDDIGPVIEAAKVLGFIETTNGDITLTGLGSQLLNAGINKRKDIVAGRLQQLPVFKEVLELINSRRGRQVRREQVISRFARRMSDEDAELLFKTLVDWGRYAGIIGYDTKGEVLYLDEEE